FALAERSAERLRRHGVAHELRAYDADHGLAPAMRADFRTWVGQVLALD
ncbi:phospholipase, partial [Xanthomonas sp. Kuri4-1]